MVQFARKNPTYDKTTFPITDPNGTTTFDYHDGAAVISVPYRNGTTSIDVAEFSWTLCYRKNILLRFTTTIRSNFYSELSS